MATLIYISGLQASNAQAQTLSVSRGFRVPNPTAGAAELNIRPGVINQVDIDNPQTRKRLGRHYDQWIEVPGNNLSAVVLRTLLIPSASDTNQSFVSRGFFIPNVGYGTVGTDATYAGYTTTTTAQSNIRYTAATAGTAGNAVTVAYVDPGGVTAALSVSVSGTAITVNLARIASALSSTGTQILAAINASPQARALVSAALFTGNDGTGIAGAFGAANLTGGAATGGTILDQDLSGATSPVTVDLTNPNVRRAVRSHIGRWVTGNVSNGNVTVRGLVTSSAAAGGGLTTRGFRIAKFGVTGGTQKVSPVTNVTVDVTDFNVRRALRRNIGRWVVVASS